MADLSRKRTRDGLGARREPYWQRLAEGAYLGFRRGPDTWVVRFRGRDHKQKYKSLGEAMEYDDAKRGAEKWLVQLSGSAVRTVKRATVRTALEAYLTDLRRHGRSEAAKDAEWRFKLYVYKDDRLPDVELEAATQDDFLEWRDRLRPGRAARTVNRNVRAVVAGLNRANRLGHVGNPSAWRLNALADDIEDDGETAVFLDVEQRAAFIAAASVNAGEFLRGMELSGSRPKELAAATVADFDGETLRIAHRKGKPPKLRVRHVVLGEEGIKFFDGQAAGKLPAAFLFTEDGKQPWRRHMWARHVRTAVTKHNKTARGKARIPASASAYSFRHARISELLQIHGIDPLTVAIQTGTSIAMIEKSYFRFIPSAMRAKLAGLKTIKEPA
jgi:integrase